ncbi:PhoX family protein [Haliangium ochraceum]|uniref:DUF839 domain-containing protein n=1 Tax=Haliangium ochraceum (strain DSM 14365 / JCM 11303 / SMP-2) TaxID=502025 RepID=D0LW24_HALO1|nr:alkaline phosphatase PhoX [Haliangium ochraceum]ACY15956.1 protein of unknown function DUF839 [Haliangium ochraceum DSM 14365]
MTTFVTTGKLPALLASLALCTAACSGDDGSRGPLGPEGPPGAPGDPAGPQLNGKEPLSATIALSFRDSGGILDADGETPRDFAAYVKALVGHYSELDPQDPDPDNPLLAQNLQFPLSAASTDTVRTLAGVHVNVVAKWFDPLTYIFKTDELDAPRFGTNPDYIAYFGDGWDADWQGNVLGSAPQYAGADSAGWVWINHEYISNSAPQETARPTGQWALLAAYLRSAGALAQDLGSDTWSASARDTVAQYAKREVGGSWVRILQDPATGEWHIDRAQEAYRYDATSATLLHLTGVSQSQLDHDDAGESLPQGVVVGISSDCSGGQTPWGTIFTGEENVQVFYGDLEAAWGSSQQFIPEQGFDPGALISPPFAPSPSGQFAGASVDVNGHQRDFHGYLAEIDPGVPPGEYEGMVAPGVGHKKIGAAGRLRWENATFVTGDDWKLLPGEPVVLYGANDRRGGRVYKFVSSKPYTAGMTRAEVRALLDEGSVYVAHFAGLDHTTGNTLLATKAAPTEAAPGTGQWIQMSVDNDTDEAPNAAALGAPGTTVGEALRDLSWNGIGGFENQDYVLWMLYTAANKIGVAELNRPEDVEYNPLDPAGPRVYVAFTNHNRQVALDQDGVLYPPETHTEQSPARTDTLGAIFAIVEEEGATPAASRSFTYYDVWHGRDGNDVHDAANPDNILIDADGAVWFGTDGNFGRNGHADGFYYLDLDPAHQDSPRPTYGQAFRVVAMPSDAENTGPAFSSRMGTLFVSVQHPGEAVFSTWPQTR